MLIAGTSERDVFHESFVFSCVLPYLLYSYWHLLHGYLWSSVFLLHSVLILHRTALMIISEEKYCIPQIVQRHQIEQFNDVRTQSNPEYIFQTQPVFWILIMKTQSFLNKQWSNTASFWYMYNLFVHNFWELRGLSSNTISFWGLEFEKSFLKLIFRT